MCGEFGGLGLPIPGHTWVEKTWGYQGVASQLELTSRYLELIKAAYDLRESEALCALVYTQTTDVETECNGALTYDREIIKLDLPQAAAANQGRFPSPQ